MVELLCENSKKALLWMFNLDLNTLLLQFLQQKSFTERQYLYIIVKIVIAFLLNKFRLLNKSTTSPGRIMVLCCVVFLINFSLFPVNIYLFNINNRNARKGKKMSKVTNKDTRKQRHQKVRRHWCRFGAFILNLKYIPHLFIVLLLLNLSMYFFAGLI